MYKATPIIAAVAVITGLSAADDRQVRKPTWGQSTDDAYVRADMIPLASRVDGYVRRVYVRDHQRVHAGDVVVEIEPAEYQARVQEAEALLAVSKTSLAACKHRRALQQTFIDAASANQDAALSDARRSRREAERQAGLAARGLSSVQEQERASYDADRADAERKKRSAEHVRAAVELQLLGDEEARLTAEIAARTAQAEQARLMLGYTTIVAPRDGILGERAVREGQLVRPGSQVVTLIDVDNIWVMASFKERQIGALAVGDTVRVSVDGFPSAELVGRVDSLSPASGAQLTAMPLDNATGNFTKIAQRIPVKILLDVPPTLRGRLVPGMSVVVTTP